MPGIQDLVNKALGRETNQGQNQPSDQNQPTVEQITEAAVQATVTHLRETGQLVKSGTTTSTQPEQPADTVVDFSKMDMSTAEGVKAFDAYVAANGKELIKVGNNES